MKYEDIKILDWDLKDKSQSELFNMHPTMQREALRRVYNWAKNHNADTVSVQRLVHPGEASALGVDDVIVWGDGYFKYGILKGYGDPKDIPRRNPRKKEMELRKPERPGNYQKITKEIDDKGATEYKFRMLPPGKFDEQSFRRKVITTGVSIVVGCPKGEFSNLFSRCKNGMAVQALRLSKSVFKTKKDAAKWIAAHVMEKY